MILFKLIGEKVKHALTAGLNVLPWYLFNILKLLNSILIKF
jgi:hypothetical protein